MTKSVSRRALSGAATLAVLGLLGVSPADAAVKTLQVTRSVTLAAPPAKVWAIIHDFADLTWVPAVKHSAATMGNTPGSVRTLDLGGPKLTERLTAYAADQMSYGYVIQGTAANQAVLPVSHYRSTLTVLPHGTGSEVVWIGQFQRVDPAANPPKGKDDAAAIGAISGVYTSGLANLAKLTAK